MLLVHNGWARDLVHPAGSSSFVGQLSEEEQVGGLEVGAVLRELLDREAA